MPGRGRGLSFTQRLSLSPRSDADCGKPQLPVGPQLRFDIADYRTLGRVGLAEPAGIGVFFADSARNRVAALPVLCLVVSVPAVVSVFRWPLFVWKHSRRSSLHPPAYVSRDGGRLSVASVSPGLAAFLAAVAGVRLSCVPHPSAVTIAAASGGATCWLGFLRRGGLSFVKGPAVCAGGVGVGSRDGPSCFSAGQLEPSGSSCHPRVSWELRVFRRFGKLACVHRYAAPA